MLLLLPLFLLATPSNERVAQAYSFCKTNNYSPNYCILIDMSMHSGRKRFFLWNFKTKEVVLKGLCSHGCCDADWASDETKTDPIFSNTPNSHCSSLGKYKVGKRGYSSWGINVNYKLHGLEKTNNNAYKRIIVLHSWVDIPDFEIYPVGTPESWGCPAVSNKVMKELDLVLKKEKKPVLLWIYK